MDKIETIGVGKTNKKKCNVHIIIKGACTFAALPSAVGGGDEDCEEG